MNECSFVGSALQTESPYIVELDEARVVFPLFSIECSFSRQARESGLLKALLRQKSVEERKKARVGSEES